MSGPSSAHRVNPAVEGEASMWSRALGGFIDARVAVFVLVSLALAGALSVAPFEGPWEGLPRDPVPVDAIPDISENQQIVFTQWPGRSPRDVEDQVSYPLTSALMGISGVRTVRSFSMMGFSTIYVIFEDDVEFYWTRSRVLEKLAALSPETLPPGVSPSLGPDATALGQVFWYTLEGRDVETGEALGGWALHELRSLQDWTVRQALQGVSGVSEVASVGGHVQELQVDVDPEAMRAAGVTLGQVAAAVRGSNMEVGARTLEINRVEYVVRGVGFIKALEDLELAVVATRDGVPVRVRDVARVFRGPAGRRGALDKDGAEAVGGVVVARFGENPQAVIERVKEKLASLAPSLPERVTEGGRVSKVRVVPFYDRSKLIGETVETLTTALWQQVLITALVLLVMLRRLRPSLLVAAMLPLAVLWTFLSMKLLGVTANVMSLAGVAVAIGTMVDMGIVLMESIVAALARSKASEDRSAVIREAAAEVAPAVWTSLATTVVSFLPVFALTAAEGKLFKPLALTKSFALVWALVAALVVLPPMARWWLRPSLKKTGEAPGLGWWRPSVTHDLALCGLGLALAATWELWVGLAVAAMGGLRLTEPWLKGTWRALPSWFEVAAAAVVVGVALTRAWMPLGAQEGLWLNLAFVAVVVGSLLGCFALFMRCYDALLAWALAHKGLFLCLPATLVLWGATAWLGFDGVFGWLPDSLRASAPVTRLAGVFPGLGREFMPAFDEGAYLYMPSTMPHASFGESLELLRAMDASISSIPEVEEVVGKIGRVDSALDPAPVSMVEAVIHYKPQWRVEEDGTRVRQWRPHIRSPGDIWDEIVAAGRLPGLTGAPMLMPINTRILMLQTGMRSPLGLKVRGPSLEALEVAGRALEAHLRRAPEVRAETVFAERVVGKPYLEIELNREALGRHGLTVAAVQEVIQVGLGGVELTRTVEGRARYGVRVRYAREERDSVEALRKVLVDTPSGRAVPLEQLATLSYVRGPQVIKSEDTFLTSVVTFDKAPGLSEVEAVERLRADLSARLEGGQLALPEGVSVAFSGTYENQVRSESRLMWLVPLALGLVFVLLFLKFRGVATVMIVFSGVVVAGSGGFILLWMTHQPWWLVSGEGLGAVFHIGPTNLSVAVWVGFIALFGIATDDGVLMATSVRRRLERGDASSVAAIRERVMEAGRRRVRPCLMTTATTLLALLPVVTSQGRGADVMVPMALPSLGGMAIELVTLFVVPVLYSFVEECRWRWFDSRGRGEGVTSSVLEDGDELVEAEGL